MRRALIALIVLALTGCGPSETEKAARERIGSAARADWSNGIDSAGLAESLRLCASIQSRDCIEVAAKARAVADAVASCAANDSALCSAVSNTKSLHQFSGGNAATLPDHPFYWNLGNELLDAQAPIFGHRGEMWAGWLERQRVVLLAALAAILAALGGWAWQSWRQAEAEEQAEAEASRKIQQARLRAAKEAALEAAQAEADRREREAAEAYAKDADRQQKEEASKAAAEAQQNAKAEAAIAKEATAAALAAAFGKPKR